MSAAMIPLDERTPTTVDGMRALGTSWPTFERMIRRAACKITKDPDDREDLIQVAQVELWEIDSTRRDLSDEEDVRDARRIMVKKMWQVWGRDHGGERKMATSLRWPVMMDGVVIGKDRS